MKVFLRDVLLFLVLLLTVNALMWLVLQRIYFKPYHDVELKKSTYLLSDSHGAVLPKTLEHGRIGNWSIGSDSYPDMERKLDFILRKGTLDTLIITVDDHTLGEYRKNVNNLDRSIDLVDCSDSRCIVKKYLRRHIIFLQPKLAQLIVKFISDKLTGARTNERHHSWAEWSESEQNEAIEERIALQFSGQGSVILEESLRRIMARCQREEITLIGLKFPVTEEYRDHSEFRDFGAASIFEEAGLRVLDFSRWNAHRPELFRDPDHLNQKGAEVFSKELREALGGSGGDSDGYNDSNSNSNRSGDRFGGGEDGRGRKCEAGRGP